MATILGGAYRATQAVASQDDVFGYDRHMRRHALAVANGVTVVILGFAVGAMLTLLPERNSADVETVVRGLDRLVGLMTKDLVELPTVQRHPETFIVEMIGVLLGYTALKRAKADDEDYRAAFERIEQFYTPRQRRDGWLAWASLTGIGVGVIVATHLLLVCFAGAWPQGLASGVARLSAAMGVWLCAYGYALGVRTDLFLYNFRNLQHVNIYELGKRESNPRRAVQLGEKRLCDLSMAVSGFALTLGAIGALALYFLPSLRTAYFWVPIVCTMVVSFVFKGVVVAYAKRRYEPDFD